MFYATVECDGETLINAAKVIHFQFGEAGRFLIDDSKEDHDAWVKFMNWHQGPQGVCRLIAEDGRSARISIMRQTTMASGPPVVTEIEFDPVTELS